MGVGKTFVGLSENPTFEGGSRPCVFIPVKFIEVCKALTDAEAGHVVTLMFDHWDALDDVNPDEEFKDEPNIKEVWDQIKELIVYGKDEDDPCA